MKKLGSVVDIDLPFQHILDERIRERRGKLGGNELIFVDGGILGITARHDTRIYKDYAKNKRTG